MKICPVGGASSTYSASALLGRNPAHQISLLTRRPEQWNHQVSCRMLAPDMSEADRLTARLFRISRDACDVVSDADIVLIIAPVHAYADCLAWVVPHLARNKDVHLGFLYGQGGVNWMAEAALRRHGIDNAHYWSFGLIPWITRTETYGAVGANYGGKQRNIVCTSSDLCFSALKDNVLNDFCLDYFGCEQVHRAGRFIELTLSVDNQIIHPSRCYAMWRSAPRGWDRSGDVPFFYRDFDADSARVLADIDRDFERVRQRIRGELANHDLSHMMDYLTLERFSYESQSADILGSFVNSRTLFNIRTPTRLLGERHVIDAHHRFFLDDTYYGLDIARELARRFDVGVPAIDSLTTWCRELMASQGVKADWLAEGLAYRQNLSAEQLLA